MWREIPVKTKYIEVHKIHGDKSLKMTLTEK